MRAPASPAEEGAPLFFAVEVEGIEPTQGTLFFRSIGARRYQGQDFDLDGRHAAVVRLPVSASAAPGVEYYVSIRGVDGSTASAPPVYPTRNPYRVEVQPGRALLGVALVEPPTGARGPSDPLVLTLPGAPDRHAPRVFLDGADITAFLRTRGDTAQYVPSSPLVPGPHQLVVAEPGGERREFPFTVAEQADRAAAPGVASLRGSLSANYGGNVGNKNGPGKDTASGNLHVEAGARKGEFSVDFSGVNLQYVKDAPDPFTVSSGYLVTTRYGQQALEVGDLSISETSLVAAGFSRRGAQLKLQSGAAEARAFNVRAETVEGFETGVSFTDNERQVYGAAFAGSLFGNRLSAHLVGISGENQAVSGYNTASLLAASKGKALGGKLDAALGRTSLGAEYAVSWFDPDTSDGGGEKRDDAYEVRAGQDLGFGNLNVGYLRYGSRYATVADPNFTGDREGYDGSFSTAAGIASWSVFGSYTEDNVDDDPTRPVVLSRAGGTAVGLSPQGWPTLQLGYSVSDQTSFQVPAGAEEVENRNHSVSAGLAYGRGFWNLSLSAALGFLDDRLPADNDTRTRTYNLGGGVFVDRLVVSPGLTLSEAVGTTRTDRSRLGTLTLSVPLWDERISLSSQGSYQLSDATDGSVDTRTVNANGRLAFNLRDLLQRLRAGWLNVDVALTASYNRFDDRKNTANDADDYAVLLGFNLGAPYQWAVERPW